MIQTEQQVARPVISVSGLSKKYCRDLRRSLWYGLGDIAREVTGRAAGDAARLRGGEFWALRDVSFEVGRGESLAVIGANGAGKSTLLKVLYGLIKPDAGSVRMAGRVGAMIELGTGFNPVLSGRENVRVNAAILGFSSAQVDPLMDRISDFAGLREFIDTPVQYYSSGMQARLSYAVAAHLNPDVLLVDEVLAVGDIAYQHKCFGHMRKYLDSGGSLVFVSHNTYQIQAICRRGIVLDRGQQTFSGTAVEALNFYFETRHGAGRAAATDSPPDALDVTRPVRIESIRAEPADGDAIRTGEGLRLTLRYRSGGSFEAVWGFSVYTGDQWVCVTGAFDMNARALAPGAGELRCLVPRLPLVAGSYLLRATILDPATLQPLAMLGWQDAPHPLTVRARPSRLNNALSAVNQLMTLEVEWE
jgi:ABC-type polysaccharide/polyol phosphate transport system ATPase subunit